MDYYQKTKNVSLTRKHLDALDLGNFHPDPEVFNPKLGQWPEEFNFRKPHEALAYQIPIEFACQNAKVSKNVLILYKNT